MDSHPWALRSHRFAPLAAGAELVAACAAALASAFAVVRSDAIADRSSIARICGSVAFISNVRRIALRFQPSMCLKNGDGFGVFIAVNRSISTDCPLDPGKP